MRNISNPILYEYWQCPYKVKLMYIDGPRDRAYTAVSNKNIDFAVSIYSAIREFYKQPLAARSLPNLENFLRATWVSGNYSSQEEERSFGLEALEILKKFYFHNDVNKMYNFIDRTLNYKIDEFELSAKYQFGEYFNSLNKFAIIDYSVSPYSIKLLKNKFDILSDFSVLNKVIAVFNNFSVEAVIYKRIFLKSAQISEFSISKKDYLEYVEFFKNKINEYLHTENFERKIGKHCGFCRLNAICQLSQEISYQENQQFFKFLRFITDLLQTDFSYSAFEKCLNEKLRLVLPQRIDYKIMNEKQTLETFGQEFTDFMIMQIDEFKLKYLEYENYYYYYASIGDYNNSRHFLIFVIESPLETQYTMHIDLLLSYIQVKCNQIKLYELSVKDKLTGLYNHGYYRHISETEISRCKRYNKKLGIILFDIDHFKKFNDTYGHQAGDFVLVGVSAVFQKSMRVKDICVRYGGEEFLAICPDISREELFALAENLRKNIETQIFQYEDKSLNVAISGGLSLYPDEARDVLSLVRIADNKLYESKAGGRNCITI